MVFGVWGGSELAGVRGVQGLSCPWWCPLDWCAGTRWRSLPVGEHRPEGTSPPRLISRTVRRGTSRTTMRDVVVRGGRTHLPERSEGGAAVREVSPDYHVEDVAGGGPGGLPPGVAERRWGSRGCLPERRAAAERGPGVSPLGARRVRSSDERAPSVRPSSPEVFGWCERVAGAAGSAATVRAGSLWLPWRVVGVWPSRVRWSARGHRGDPPSLRSVGLSHLAARPRTLVSGAGFPASLGALLCRCPGPARVPTVHAVAWPPLAPRGRPVAACGARKRRSGEHGWGPLGGYPVCAFQTNATMPHRASPVRHRLFTGVSSRCAR